MTLYVTTGKYKCKWGVSITILRYTSKSIRKKNELMRALKLSDFSCLELRHAWLTDREFYVWHNPKLQLQLMDLDNQALQWPKHRQNKKWLLENGFCSVVAVDGSVSTLLGCPKMLLFFFTLTNLEFCYWWYICWNYQKVKIHSDTISSTNYKNTM